MDLTLSVRSKVRHVGGKQLVMLIILRRVDF